MKKIIETIVDLILPQSPLIKRIERMNTYELYRQTTKAEPPSEGWMHPLFDYSHPLIKTAVWELKYRGNRKIARLLALALYEKLEEELSEMSGLPARGGCTPGAKKPLIIPIPLSAERRRERGFNQCEYLLQELEQLDKGRTFEGERNILVKIRHTTNQTKMSKQSRLKNLSGCFGVKNSERLLDKRVILIDDVVTTGATLIEARKTLRVSGAGEITAYTIAH